jgi:hypothetical protein
LAEGVAFIVLALAVVVIGDLHQFVGGDQRRDLLGRQAKESPR